MKELLGVVSSIDNSYQLIAFCLLFLFFVGRVWRRQGGPAWANAIAMICGVGTIVTLVWAVGTKLIDRSPGQSATNIPPSRSVEPSSVSQKSEGANSPNIANVGGPVTVQITHGKEGAHE